MMRHVAFTQSIDSHVIITRRIIDLIQSIFSDWVKQCFKMLSCKAGLMGKNWLCSPVYLMIKVGNLMRICEAVGTLIVLFWKLARCWMS